MHDLYTSSRARHVDSRVGSHGDGKVWGGARSDLVEIQDVNIWPLLVPWPAANVLHLRGLLLNPVTLRDVRGRCRNKRRGSAARMAGSRSSARCEDTPLQTRRRLILAGVGPGLYRLETLCAFPLRTRPSLRAFALSLLT